MTKRTIGNGVALYRFNRKDAGHVAEHDLGFIAPIYRGFKLACLGGEIEALRRKVDDFWSTR